MTATNVLLCCVFATLMVISASTVSAQCSQGPTPDVCKYGTNPLNIFPGSLPYDRCVSINQNPFAVKGVFSGDVSAEECETFARRDGENCIRFYTRVQCSGGCQLCGRGICQSFCDNHATVCPTPTANGCFENIFCEPNAPCSNWEVSTGNLPDPIRTTTTRVTTSSTSNTGTGTTTDGDDSGAAQLSICATLIIFAVFSIFV